MEQLWRDLFARALDAVGNTQLRQRSAHADDGNGPRRVAIALSKRKGRSRVLEMTPMKRKSRVRRAVQSTNHDPGRFSVAEMENLAERLLKLSDADETEVEIALNVDALTRFANKTLHQNVAEHTLSISVRVVLDGRTARTTTNKTDDDSLRRLIAAANSLAHNQP